MDFLLEERTPEMAHKILDRIQKHKRYQGLTGIVHRIVPRHKDYGLEHEANKDRFKKVTKKEIKSDWRDEDVPLHKIYSAQGYTMSASVHKKIDGTDEHQSSDKPLVFYHRATDTYHVKDGNHRIASQRLLKKSHVSVKVKDI